MSQKLRVKKYVVDTSAGIVKTFPSNTLITFKPRNCICIQRPNICQCGVGEPAHKLKLFHKDDKLELFIDDKLTPFVVGEEIILDEDKESFFCTFYGILPCVCNKLSHRWVKVRDIMENEGPVEQKMGDTDISDKTPLLNKNDVKDQSIKIIDNEKNELISNFTDINELLKEYDNIPNMKTSHRKEPIVTIRLGNGASQEVYSGPVKEWFILKEKQFCCVCWSQQWDSCLFTKDSIMKFNMTDDVLYVNSKGTDIRVTDQVVRMNQKMMSYRCIGFLIPCFGCNCCDCDNVPVELQLK
jgi:hypothetical protein